MPLHDDGPGDGVPMPDGRVIRNVTDDEYDAMYDEGEPCQPIPADVLADATASAGTRILGADDLGDPPPMPDPGELDDPGMPDISDLDPPEA